ncbi:hypothetical protein ACWDTQ_32585 [Streptomyces cellulosae]
MNRARALVVTALAAAVLLTGCGSKPGPAGTVVDRDRTYWPATKQWTYKLTTEDARGKRTTFKVKRSVYKNCFHRSKYPKCTNR